MAISRFSQARAKSYLDKIVCSEGFASFQSERTESGSYSRNNDDRDRFARCYDAAEHGADGMTPAEHLQDQRDYLHLVMQDRRRWADPDRFLAAVEAEIDAIEAWWEAKGGLYEPLG